MSRGVPLDVDMCVDIDMSDEPMSRSEGAQP